MHSTATDSRELLARFGRLLLHPSSGIREALGGALALLGDDSPQARKSLVDFEREIAALDEEALDIAYTRAFDLSPLCAPYLSIHLFGEESFKRAELMAALVEYYHRVGHDHSPELPDHVAAVLLSLPHLPDDEWVDFRRYCLKPAIPAMSAALAASNSPYRHLMEAIRAFLQTAFPSEDFTPCSTSSSSARYRMSPASCSCSAAPGATGAIPSATPPCLLSS